jgi:uncharacterized OB-fold protein
MLQRCLDCEGKPAYFYPRPFCPACLSRNVESFEASGRATLHTYVIAHRGSPGFEDKVPHVIAIVELEEGPRMMTNLMDVDPTPERLPVGLQLQVAWEDHIERGGDGANRQVSLPVFRPAETTS